MPRIIEVVDYDPVWIAAFEKEMAKEPITIEHQLLTVLTDSLPV